ncbi:chromosomal replication initiator protein DnaA [Candidatus Roizmanbacteria bacterium]|nr:chromosomal replication initiator protein DnaA [Candidatus Roizmanbacteria bacterium]
MLQSFWDGFLHHIEKNSQQNPVVFTVLQQIHPAKLTDDTLVVSCENTGVKMFLQKKTEIIEHLLQSYTQKRMTIEFVIEEKRSKKEPPLLRFQPTTEDMFVRAGIHVKYRFDNFAVSSTNQVAYAAAQAVSRAVGSAYNPLFLYGGVGVGKTHLAQAVARYILEQDPAKKVFFCPGDQFTNEIIEAIRERTTPKFRRKYRLLHVILVDDIQFIAGKQTVQEEFFHTFNAVVSSGGQIILTSDRPPVEIKNLEDRLRSRFSGGLIVDLQPPDFELRTAILLIKAKEKGVEIDMEAAKVIAQETIDARVLEGTLLSIYAKTLGVKDRIDLEVVDSYFQDKVKKFIKKTTPHDIIKAVCSYYNVKQSHIKSPLRSEEIVLPRQIIMYLLRTELEMKLEDIAYLLKRKDHTTIMHGCEKIVGLLMKNPLLKQEVDKITQTITASI